MQEISLSDNYALYDVTPIENLFLLEFMPYAPGDAVKVYLYGLAVCRYPDKDLSIKGVSRALEIPEENVVEALRYWERKGLMMGVSDNPPTFQYMNVRSAMIESAKEENPAYKLHEYNERLQSMFGILHAQQFRLAAEWVEELNLPQDVVLYMCEKTNELLTLRNGGKPRSTGYIFKVLKDKAVDWANRGVNTMEMAINEMEKELPPNKLAKTVIDKLGMKRRNASVPEIALCAKWLGEWGLDEETIIKALDETTKATNPSFGYLDGILSGMRSRTEQENAAYPEVKAVLEALGAASRTPTIDIIRSYIDYIDKGFAHETILRAAAKCNSHNQHSFRKLEDVLEKWMKLGLTTPEAVNAYLQKRESLRSTTLEVFERAGVNRSASDADIDQVGQWLNIASLDLIIYAASCAKGMSLPMRYIEKRLGEWKAAGVATVDSAMAYTSVKPATKSLFHQFDHRETDDGYYDGLFVDLNDASGKDG
ncbi:MAG: DnaD domain protein [Clostridia bacterium]|nr:DnaD domain protein [Clostridia bacterium]